MKKFTNEQYAKALYEVVKNKDKKAQAEAVRVFADRLRRDRRLADSSKIIDAFTAYEKKQAGQIVADVTSRGPVASKLKKHMTQVWGDKLEVVDNVEPKMLGGARLRIGDTVYDATLDAQLKKLRQHLIAS